MKLRVTVDIDKIDLGEYGSLERGVFGCDRDGLYHLFYGNRSNLLEFENVEVLEE